MPLARIRALVIGLTALGLSGCAYTGLDGGYGGLSVGIGSGGYDHPYYGRHGSYYDPYGYDGWGAPRYGWHQGYYYPGQGAFVYDRAGRRYAMRPLDRQYWQQHQARPPGWHRKHRKDRPGALGRRPDGQGAIVAGPRMLDTPTVRNPTRRDERLERRRTRQGERAWQANPTDPDRRRPSRRQKRDGPIPHER